MCLYIFHFFITKESMLYTLYLICRLFLKIYFYLEVHKHSDSSEGCQTFSLLRNKSSESFHLTEMKKMTSQDHHLATDITFFPGSHQISGDRKDATPYLAWESWPVVWEQLRYYSHHLFKLSTQKARGECLFMNSS